jgi:hypothetical protein
MSINTGKTSRRNSGNSDEGKSPAAFLANMRSSFKLGSSAKIADRPAKIESMGSIENV